MKYVYVIKNNLTKTYNDPIYRFEDFKTVTRQLHDFIILAPEEAKKQYLHISTVCLIGQFFEDTGKIVLFEDEDLLEEYNLQEAWDQLQSLKEVVANG